MRMLDEEIVAENERNKELQATLDSYHEIMKLLKKNGPANVKTWIKQCQEEKKMLEIKFSHDSDGFNDFSF